MIAHPRLIPAQTKPTRYESMVQLTVKRPRDTVPTNFSTETPREAMVIVEAYLADKQEKVKQSVRARYMERLNETGVRDVVFPGSRGTEGLLPADADRLTWGRRPRTYRHPVGPCLKLARATGPCT